MTISDFEFFRLPFDKTGTIAPGAELSGLTQSVAGGPASDVLFLAHGFRNDERDATDLYTQFLKTLRTHLERPEFKTSLGHRHFAIAGVFWPSQEFPESPDVDPNSPPTVHPQRDTGSTAPSHGSAEVRLQPPSVHAAAGAIALASARARLQELRDGYATAAQRPKIDRALALLPSVESSRTAQDEFVALVFTLLEHTADDPTEGGQQIRAQAGSDLLDRLAMPVVIPTGNGNAARAGGFLGSVIGGINQLLNFTTWYLMRDRSGAIGATGVAAAVRTIRAAGPAVKLHLVGHSLGARLMTACAKSLCTPPSLKVDSLILLEGAFSHYGFSKDNGHGAIGFFRDVIGNKIVKGPMVATYSVEDTVVGYAYAMASRLAGDNARAIGDAHDEFGGLGRNGTQKTTESVQDVLHAAGTPYHFKNGVITNLNGSGGLIKDHGDVTNTTVTYAVASALART